MPFRDRSSAKAARPPAGPLKESSAGGGMEYNPLGLGSFLALTAAGVFSKPVFNAIAVLSDILPLPKDLAALLGFPGDGTPDINWSYALPGLIVFAVLFFAALSSPSVMNAVNAAGDILPFPADLAAAAGVGGNA